MKLLRIMLLISSIAGVARVCGADDAVQLIAQLKSLDSDWQAVFTELHYSATVSILRPKSTEPDEVYEFEFDQLRPDRWRLDQRRNGPGSLVRDGEFWFSAAGSSEGGRYDRLGFDNAATASIGGSLVSQNTILASATHLLDIPLSRFVSIPGVQWEGAETPVTAESQHRLRWTLTPGVDDEYLPAFGAIEWVMEENHAWLTHYEYYFGKSDKNDPKGVVVNVWYDRYNGRLLPSRSLRSESGVKTETTRGQTSAAKTDLEFYSPAAFGLARPTKPWQSYQIWGLLGLSAFTVGIGLRWWRTRTIRYVN